MLAILNKTYGTNFIYNSNFDVRSRETEKKPLGQSASCFTPRDRVEYLYKMMNFVCSVSMVCPAS